MGSLTKNSMGKSFLNKVVIVTGSGSGIGKTTAQQFCKEGAKVVLNGRDEAKLKITSETLSSLRYEVVYFAGDVTNYETCKQLVEFTIKSFGTINVLVTNGGVSMNAQFDEMTPDLFKMVFDSNVYGAVMPVYAALDVLKQSKGSVIFIGSVAGFHGIPTASAYSAGKMALTAIQQSIGSELQKHGVHVGILYVGFTENDADKKLISSNGEWLSVPKRPRLLQQSQNKVARSVLLMAKYRQNKKTLSLIGICTSLLTRLAPGIIGSLTKLSQKKIRSNV
jgi:NAD(P)-dependent dehydrogenase (short-subunit alcohol dehydrogenase family)